MGLNAIGYAPLLSMTALFLLELAEDKAECRGVHVPGTLFALAGIVTALSSMAASMLVNLILVSNGYVGGELVQPAQAISGIEGMYTWGAALPLLLALVLVLLLPAVRDREKQFWRR